MSYSSVTPLFPVHRQMLYCMGIICSSVLSLGKGALFVWCQFNSHLSRTYWLCCYVPVTSLLLFSRFLHCKVTPPTLFLFTILKNNITKHSPHSTGRKLSSTSFRGYTHTPFGILIPSTYLLNNLFISVCFIVTFLSSVTFQTLNEIIFGDSTPRLFWGCFEFQNVLLKPSPSVILKTRFSAEEPNFL